MAEILTGYYSARSGEMKCIQFCQFLTCIQENKRTNWYYYPSPSLFCKEAPTIVKDYSHLEAPRKDPKFVH